MSKDGEGICNGVDGVGEDISMGVSYLQWKRVRYYKDWDLKGDVSGLRVFPQDVLFLYQSSVVVVAGLGRRSVMLWILGAKLDMGGDGYQKHNCAAWKSAGYM